MNYDIFVIKKNKGMTNMDKKNDNMLHKLCFDANFVKQDISFSG